MGVVQLDRRCIEVLSDDYVLRYGWIIETHEGEWAGLSLSNNREHNLVGFYTTPHDAFKALVDAERGQPWERN